MKKIVLYISLLTLILPFAISKPTETGYIVIAWNDVGMHFSNKDFSTFLIAPPYNNIYAQVIKTGASPQLVTSGIKVTYEIPGNTYSVGKTNFWEYTQKLFGTTLSPNKGLKGAGLSGNMVSTGNYFLIEGVPLTPYLDTDTTKETPYQQALIKVYDAQTNELLATSNPVIPVSNEITCIKSGCHASESGIVSNHGAGIGSASKPIVCNSCHPSNPKWTQTTGKNAALSYRIHTQHSNKTSNCYDCHPGAKAKFFRDTMANVRSVKTPNGMACTDCHGTMSEIASSISKNGRLPWVQEKSSCGDTTCHGPTKAANSGKLFKDSQGHGGLFCSVCHGSPHAIFPTNNANDNARNLALQEKTGTLNVCSTCHITTPTGQGPHGILGTSVEIISSDTPINYEIQNYPNPVNQSTTFNFKIADYGNIKIDIFSYNGNHIATLVNEYLQPGEYKIPYNTSSIISGCFIYTLTVNNKSVISRKMNVVRE